jgi:Putative MetA-pathway of phenol degradation
MAGRRSAVDGKQRRLLARGCVVGALIVGSSAQATDESRDDAWWTGPMTAASAAMLPQGHILIEPYLYDVVTTGRFDTNGRWEPAPGEHDLGSLTYLLYGLTDRVTVGVIPRLGVNQPDGQPSGSGIGDTTLQAGYGLTRYQVGGWIPEISVVLDETLPTGRYDRLAHLSEGLGAGSYTTALAVYSQYYFWAPNGRIVRTRLDLTYSVSSTVSLRDQSVYGTAPAFQGEARPGDSFTADAAAEYSLTRNWVLALDVIYQRGAGARVIGSQRSAEGGTAAVSAFTSDSVSSYLVGFAPAVEYNWNGSVGILMGVRVFEIGRNVTATVTPVIAINLAL